MRIGAWLLSFAILLCGCVEAVEHHTKLPPGMYRAVLDLNTSDEINAAEEVNTILNVVEQGELPFNFEVVYDDSGDNFHIIIHNDDERIRVDQIQYGIDRATNNDTILIEFPIFDTYIKGIYKENVIDGEWVVNFRENYSIPFVAYHGLDHRFTNIKKENEYNLDGRWKCTFSADTEDEDVTVGNFKQSGNKVTGTFKTETGDYRFLEGNIIDNKFYLSVFDGSHAFLFEGKFIDADNIIGSFTSGVHYKTTWNGTRDNDYELHDPFDLTKSLADTETIDFSFKNTEGNMVSLQDEKYKDKVKIVKIMGTWCPNCMDATNFLLDYLEDNSNENLEVMAIGFERYRDESKSLTALKRYKERKGIPFEVLFGGYFEKAESTEKLPFLDKIISYPTLLFIDKHNKLRKVHTGFSGPATDKYEGFKQDFNNTVESLLSEV